MKKTRREIEVGVKYSGYGVLNEFGEWSFIPSQVGSRAGRKKFVCGGENYSIYSTTKKVIIHCTLERGETIKLVQQWLKICDNLLLAIRHYDFGRLFSSKNERG